jgi:hypothetical protein
MEPPLGGLLFCGFIDAINGAKEAHKWAGILSVFANPDVTPGCRKLTDACITIC